MERLLTILGLVLLQFTSIYGACPNATSIAPCTCSDENSSQFVITCISVTREDDLKYAMKSVRKQKNLEVRLHYGSFRFFMEGTFNGTDIKSLEIRNSSILSLGETESVKLGFEDSLQSLKVDDCPFVNSWEWKNIQKLKKLQILEIRSSGLLELTEDFLGLSNLSLEEINLNENFIDRVPNRAFANFVNLQKLNLDRNDLTFFNRSMLPTPAKKLQSLGISYNKIRSLPADAFTDMPALKFLYIGGNPLYILEERTFKPVWHQLGIVFIQESPLLCACHFSWITNAKRAKMAFITGKCESPYHLKGKKITELKSEDLRC